jgi:hypothetical protein
MLIWKVPERFPPDASGTFENPTQWFTGGVHELWPSQEQRDAFHIWIVLETGKAFQELFVVSNLKGLQGLLQGLTQAGVGKTAACTVTFGGWPTDRTCWGAGRGRRL